MSPTSTRLQPGGMSSPPEFELFVVHAEADRAWVDGYLKPMLGLEPARVFTPRDFRLGASVPDEFERGVVSSRFTLLVLSPAFLADRWAEFGEGLVSFSSVDEGRNRLLALTLHPCQAPLRLRFRESLDCTDWTRWDDEAARLRRHLDAPEPTVEAAPCPYPGMVPFREEDARFFHGRDAEIRQLLTLVRQHHFLAVVGSSGSGKSSLITAGLLPRLDDARNFPRGTWRVLSLRPGATPLEELARVLGGPPDDPVAAVARSLAAEPPAQRLLLIVDQFEELFSQVEDAATRGAFIGHLKALRADPRCTVLLTMRADFYGDLMNSPLWPIDRSQLVEVAALRGDALRQAIVKPVEAVGVYLEEGLVERLLADAADEPGSLPMLQEALVLLWGTMSGRLLTRASYAGLGHDGRSGLAVAMATKADATLAVLPAAQQKLARRIFLRLVQFGEGRADTRRQQPVAELSSAGDDPQLFDQTLRHLADHRLLTLSGEQGDADRKVDIAHEMLIVGWPRSRAWVQARREAELARRRLEAKAEEWTRLVQESGGLLDEVELLEAERWLSSPDADDLGYDETLPALVRASRARIEAERASARRHTRNLITGLAAGLALVAALAVWAGIEAKRARQAETIADARLKDAERLRLVSITQALAVQAPRQRDQSGQDERGALLARQAYLFNRRSRGHVQGQVDDSLRSVLSERYFSAVLDGHENVATSVAFSPDGRRLASGSYDYMVRLWDLGQPGAAPAILAGHTDAVAAVAFSPDGRRLASASHDRTVRLWDLGQPGEMPIVLRRQGDMVWSVAFSPDGRWLASGRRDGTVWLWDPRQPGADPIVLRLDKDDAAAPRVLPGPGGAVPERSPRRSSGDVVPAMPEGPEGAVVAVAFSPDSRRLASGSRGGTVYLWDLTHPEADPTALPGPKAIASSVAFSPDGRRLAVGCHDRTVRLWDLTHPEADPTILPVGGGLVWSVAFSPDGRRLAVGSGRVVLLLAVQQPGSAPFLPRFPGDMVPAPPPSPSLEVGAAPARLRSPGDGVPAPAPALGPGPRDTVLHLAVLRGHEVAVVSVAFSPDGLRLASASYDRTVRLWDLGQPGASPAVLFGHHESVTTVAFSPDGRRLASGSRDATVRLWDLGQPGASPAVLRGQEDGVEGLGPSPMGRMVLSVAFSPDGRWLASGCHDPMIRLWDLGSRRLDAGPRVLRGHKSGVRLVAFSPDSRRLASVGYDNTVRHWDLGEPNPASTVQCKLEDGASMVALSSDIQHLVSSSLDGPVRLWKLRQPNAAVTALQGAQGMHGSGPLSTAFSPDGQRLAAGYRDGMVRLWDLRQPDAAPTVLRGHEGQVWSVAFNPDGRMFASGGHDGTVRLWDLRQPDTISTVLRRHEDEVLSVAFSPDGQRLASGSADRTVRIWIVRTEALAEMVCERVRRNLTMNEWRQFVGEGIPYERTCPNLPSGQGAPPNPPAAVP